jgi:hypothetical protein
VKKIPTVFVRSPDDRRYVTDEVNPGCEWVLTGEGVATRKYDGTCVLLDPEGGWYARREVKPGKTPPDGFWPEQHDEVTGKTVGWEPIGSSPFVKFFDEAHRIDVVDGPFTPGTYELCGPKINGNPEGMTRHILVPHASAERPSRLIREGFDDGTNLSPQAMVWYLGQHGWEGIVWHHPDGRMAKLKARDLRPS